MSKSAPLKVCLECRSTYRTTRLTCPKDGHELMARELPVGAVLAGKYLIGEEIGRGGMGVVCRGRHIIMDKAVAIKLINPLFSADEKFLGMFKAEARALAAFRHPNVLAVHDFGESEGRYFLVMELLEGKSLKDLMTDMGSIPPERAFRILIKICDAVAAAHHCGIIHLDLKGENVFVIDGGSGTDLKVLDFGLAQLAGAVTVAADNTVMGTVGYMAPEQLTGRGVDERTDVYALGVLAFEMLTGEMPFPGDSKTHILRSQVEGRFRKWPRNPALAAVPKATRSEIMAAMRSDPARRPQSVEELAGSFAAALEHIEIAARRLARKHGLPGSAAGRRRPSIVQRVKSRLAGSRREPRRGPPAPEGMVYVPAGNFIMGSNHGHGDQAPAFKVPLEAFFIDLRAVTNMNYTRFVQETDHNPPETWKTLSCPPGEGDLPVTGITWQDAADYAAWVGKRLPTEAEWEKAARSIDGRPFPWGKKWEPTFANWRGNPRFFGRSKLEAVGSFPDDRSPFGCLDMAGNVMEWTASWYQPYGPIAFKSDDFGEKFRVVRGGSYLSSDRAYLLCAHRGHARPETTGVIGFRCVKDM